MSETIPGYGPLPEPASPDRELLRSKIAMFLKSSAGDPGARGLLQECALALAHWQQAERGWQKRIETALLTIERSIGDGK